MSQPELTVEAVNVSQRLALMSNGAVRPVTHLFDRNGDATEDPQAAVSCVVKNHESSWFAVNLGVYERVALQ